MDKIFDQAKDKNVAAIVIYGKGSDKKAYLDSDCTIQFKTSELQDAFLKRAVIKIGEAYFVPTGFAVSSNIGTITYAKAGSSEGSAATATLVSVAD